ncbi:MAG: DUF2975 domain-containing protein, partial [Dysgonamonadaceae bacterium]|jgi:uncharacterized membrane protein YidH (DUF202 family)|nr:DUF2975 domain-containing protein [Dysgonamonadaceae bacterium]
MFIIIYLPVQSFKVVRSIARDDIFDEKNILRIRRIGYSLILMFLIAIFIAFTSMATARYMVSLKDYRVLFPLDSTDIFTLIFGILVLIFAEILKIATQIKEEQDLTV